MLPSFGGKIALGEPSATVRARVEAARKIQHARFGVDSERELRGSSQLRKTARIFTNADMGPAEVREHCKLDDAGKALLRATVQQLLAHRPETDGHAWPVRTHLATVSFRSMSRRHNALVTGRNPVASRTPFSAHPENHRRGSRPSRRPART